MCSVYESKVKQRLRAYLMTGKRWEHGAARSVFPHYEIPLLRLADGGLELHIGNWSLLPKWEKGKGPLPSTHNAQRERLTESRLWRGPWRRGQRCLIPASSFFESQGVGAKRKRKWNISVGDQEEFCFAGLWRTSTKPDGETIDCATIITLEAGPLMAEIHNTNKRQPAILEESQIDAWLDGSVEQAEGLLQRLPDELLIAKPIDEPKDKLQEAQIDAFG